MKVDLKNQSGQLIIEAVLILVMLFGVTYAASTYFRNQEILKQLITAPWQSLAGMLQNGNWGTPEATASLHPNANGRHISIEGEVAR